MGSAGGANAAECGRQITIDMLGGYRSTASSIAALKSHFKEVQDEQDFARLQKGGLVERGPERWGDND